MSAICAVISGSLAAIVDVSTLAKAVIYSLVAGIGITTAFGVGVTSTAGLVEAVRSNRVGPAIAWGAATAVCACLVVGGIVTGIVVMASG